MLKNLYGTGSYPFNYIIFPYDKNKRAQSYMISQFKLYWVPSIYWDGGYQVQIGSSGIAQNINTCKVRSVADVDAELTVYWVGNGTLNISVKVANNDPTAYDGYIRVYVVEKVSTLGWKDYNQNLYTFPFLDFAIKKTIQIPAGGTWQETTTWDGNLHNDGFGNTFGNITPDNVMVVAALFDGTPHQKYSNPPSGSPFSAYYLDETVSAEPEPLGIDTLTLPEAGGSLNFTLWGDRGNANRKYFLLGSVSGTSPGIPLPGGQVTLPLNWDFFTEIVFQLAHTPVFMNFQGTLDGNGNASAQMNAPGALPPGMVGTTPSRTG